MHQSSQAPGRGLSSETRSQCHTKHRAEGSFWEGAKAKAPSASNHLHFVQPHRMGLSSLSSPRESLRHLCKQRSDSRISFQQPNRSAHVPLRMPLTQREGMNGSRKQGMENNNAKLPPDSRPLGPAQAAARENPRQNAPSPRHPYTTRHGSKTTTTTTTTRLMTGTSQGLR
jgi:hypothetical protein